MAVSYDIPDWVRNHRRRTWEWFQTVQVAGHPAWIRVCTKGDTFKPDDRAGLGFTALGFKLAQMLDFFSLAEGDLRQAMIDRIKSFQVAEGESRGYFEDPRLLRAVDRRGLFRRAKDMDARRAETRQAIVALKGEGAQPDIPLDFMFDTPDAIRAFIRGLPWDSNPWHCGSHCAHLMVFLRTNAELFGRTHQETNLLPIVIEELDHYYVPDLGSWFTGDPPPNQKINAAMKVYSGFDFIGKRAPGAEALIDFALDTAVEAGACNHVDLMYVLNVASKATDHRREEVRRVAFEALEPIREHIQPDGGLCYRMEGTQRHYYGAKVSRGRQGIGDLHGTKLFTWCIALAADLLGWREELGWKLPIT